MTAAWVGSTPGPPRRETTRRGARAPYCAMRVNEPKKIEAPQSIAAPARSLACTSRQTAASRHSPTLWPLSQARALDKRSCPTLGRTREPRAPEVTSNPPASFPRSSRNPSRSPASPITRAPPLLRPLAPRILSLSLTLYTHVCQQGFAPLSCPDNSPALALGPADSQENGGQIFEFAW